MTISKTKANNAYWFYSLWTMRFVSLLPAYLPIYENVCQVTASMIYAFRDSLCFRIKRCYETVHFRLQPASAPRVFSFTLVTVCAQVTINVVSLLTDSKCCTLIDFFGYFFAVAELYITLPWIGGLTALVCSDVTFSVSVSAADAELK